MLIEYKNNDSRNFVQEMEKLKNYVENLIKKRHIVNISKFQERMNE